MAPERRSDGAAFPIEVTGVRGGRQWRMPRGVRARGHLGANTAEAKALLNPCDSSTRPGKAHEDFRIVTRNDQSRARCQSEHSILRAKI